MQNYQASIDGFLSGMLKSADNSKKGGLKEDVSLMPHQENAVQKAIERDGDIVFAHKVGTGKTLTSIATFEKLREQGKASKALVVTPASLRENFVMNGVNKFTKSKSVILGNSQEVKDQKYQSPDKPPGADYYVVSYDMYRKDPEKYIKNTGADTVIYDELHKIKNDDSITYEAIKKARPLHRNFIGLTGSVVSNNPADIVPLIDSMTNGQHSLGSKGGFKTRFVGTDKKGNEYIKEPKRLKVMLNPYVDFVENIESSVGKMPKKIIAEEYVQMSPHQETLYRYVMDKLDPLTAIKIRLGLTDLKKKEISNIFSQIIQARQVSNAIHPMDKSFTLSRSAKESPKVKKLIDDVMEHLGETPDGHAVVHTQLIHGGVDVLEQGFKDRGIEPAIFIGKGQPGITEEKRQQAVQDYKSGKKKVMVISSAGSEGLSLGNTTMIAGLDGHFNPERILQAEARGVRVDSLQHRPEEQRQVLVKRDLSTVPRSYTGTIKGIWDNISPTRVLGRIFETKNRETLPMFYNPFKGEASTDEWIKGISDKKLKLNTEFKDLLNKAAADYNAPGFYSDKTVMHNYWDELGDALDKQEDIGKPFDDRQHSEAEQRYVTELREYYTAASKGGKGAFTSNLVENEDTLKKLRIALPITAAAITPIMALQFTLPAVSEAIQRRSIKPLALPAALAALGGAVFGGLSLYDTLRGRYYTTPKTRAKKYSRFNDDQLRSLLRGLSIKEEKIKEHYIK